MALWRTHNGTDEAATTEADGELTCQVWGGGEAEVRLCTHEGGHTRRSGWAERMLAWFAEAGVDRPSTAR